VLMDVHMPGMDGLEATRTIRANPDLNWLPIIAMTAAAMPQDRQAAMNAGMNDYITKPLVPREMLTALARWIEPRRLPDALPISTVPESASAFPTLTGIDNVDVAIRLGGNLPMFQSILGRFAEEFVDTVPFCRVALEQASPMEAAHHIHRMRGVAGNLSAVRVAELGGIIETALLEGPLGEVPALLDSLESELAQLITTIRGYLSGLPDDLGERPQDVRIVKEAIVALRIALLARNIRAIDMFEKLKSSLQTGYGAAFVNKLAKAVEEMKFDEALTVLEQQIPSKKPEE